MGRYLPTIFCTIYYGPQWMKEEQGSIFQQKKKIIHGHCWNQTP
jgi:hypothetical protein